VPELVLILLIVLVAAFIKFTVGFGESLIAMPLLTLVLGLHTTTPLVGLIGATMTVALLGDGWRHLERRTTWRIVLAAGIGVPVGLFGVRYVPSEIVTRGLGVLEIAFAAYRLCTPKLVQVQGAGWTYGFGFLAGVLGSAYNTSGPPLVLYGALRGWQPAQFRATMQGCFLPISMLTIAGQSIGGLWTGRVLQLYLYCLPVMLLAYGGSRLVARRLTPQHFERIVYIVILIAGVMLLR